jgi:DNA-binding CsgD family transcriptional regulator
LPDRAATPSLDGALPFREIVELDPDRGVVLFDASLRQSYANVVGRTHVLDPAGPVSAALREALAAAKARDERGETTGLPEVPVVAADGRALRVEIVSLRREGSRWYVARICPPGVTTEPSIRRLQARFHITIREAEIALEVGRGLSNNEVAARLGVTEKTVKNALVAIFAKCAVRNRVELAMRVHDVAIPAPGRR